MKENVKIRVTVLKRLDPKQVFPTSPLTLIGPQGPCDKFQDGQTFIVENLVMPQNFCPIAWLTIANNVRLLSYGCNFPWFKEEGVTINSCTDGLRPVIFKLERIK